MTRASRDSIQDQVERWGAEAKRLAEAGREVAALDLYRKAADALPGAPWLQQRTAELARKLRQYDVAILYFRRSAAAFIAAGFDKRAIAPLRAAWTIARDEMPSFAGVLVEVSTELSEVLESVGLHTDAHTIVECTEDALRQAGLRSQTTLRREPVRPSGVVASDAPDAEPLPLERIRSR
ncbi:MAG: hypothetical protein DIU78_013860 [Pseudomonadota bacterium]